MITVRLWPYRRQMPTSWAEVSPGQKSRLVALFYKGLARDVLLLQALPILLRINRFYLRFFDYSGTYRLTELAQFIVTHPVEAETNHFPRLAGLLGTDNVLRDFQLLEYINTEAAFLAWVDNPSEHNLNIFLAHWYRKPIPARTLERLHQDPTWDGDLRTHYSDYKLKQRTKTIATAPLGHKLLAAHFFASQIALLPQLFPQIKSAKGESQDGAGWGDTIIALSPINEEDRTSRNKLTTILKRIENEHIAYERAARKNRTS